MELGLSGVRINRDPEITTARTPGNNEQAEHLEKAKRAAVRATEISFGAETG